MRTYTTTKTELSAGPPGEDFRRLMWKHYGDEDPGEPVPGIGQSSRAPG